MDVTRTEEEQLEALKQWWAENGLSVVGGIAIGIAAIFGWRGWEAHQLARASAASDLYANVIGSLRAEKPADARTAAKQLLDEYQSTSYAVYAALTLAKLDAEDGNLSAAKTHLQWALDHAEQESFKQLARLRLARVLLDDGKPDEALTLLNAASPGKFSASYDELKGDIHLKKGDIDKARAAYQLAQTAMDPASLDDSYLQLKIDSLGRQPQ